MSLAPSTTVSRVSGLPISLRGLLFATFVGACVSRWLAHYGIGLTVALGWCAGIGLVVGGIVGLVAYSVCVVRRFGSQRQVCNALEVVSCAAVGAMAGFACGAIGFALAITMLGPIEPVLLHGLWVRAMADRGPPAYDTDMSGTLGAFMVLPASIGAASIAIARVFFSGPRLGWRYICCVSGASSLAVGLFPLVAVFVWLFFFPPPPSRENMLGLLPIALVLWCGISAFVGAVAGASMAGLWLWVSYARRTRTGWIVLWLLAAWVVLFATEAGLRD